MKRILLAVGVLLLASCAVAQSTSANPAPTWKTFSFHIPAGRVHAVYSRKGLELSADDEAFKARIQWRLQTRFAAPFDADPRKSSQFTAEDPDQFVLRRARFKLDGQAFKGFVTYKFERDLVGHQLLDLYGDVNFKPWLSVRVGQWKSIFSQERYISSGRQQFVERSIVNREFTIDRQAGLAVNGRVAGGTRADSFYSFEVLGGAGINSGFFRDAAPLLMARYQWNFLKADPGVLSGDMTRRKTPAAMVAFSAAGDRSAFTRFSSSGASQLDGFTAGAPGQYKNTQFNAEFLFKYRGLSIQSENHWKSIADTVKARTRALRGSYVAVGYFLHEVWQAVPRDIEVAYRYAYVDPNTANSHDLRFEHSMAVNLFLENHENKLTFDLSHLSLSSVEGPSAMRYRVQYDVHF